jgi:hypothetical protein
MYCRGTLSHLLHYYIEVTATKVLLLLLLLLLLPLPLTRIILLGTFSKGVAPTPQSGENEILPQGILRVVRCDSDMRLTRQHREYHPGYISICIYFQKLDLQLLYCLTLALCSFHFHVAKIL